LFIIHAQDAAWHASRSPGKTGFSTVARFRYHAPYFKPKALAARWPL